MKVVTLAYNCLTHLRLRAVLQPLNGIWRNLTGSNSHTKKRGSYPQAARGQCSRLPMGILPWKWGCPLLPYVETVDSQLLPTSKKVGSSDGQRSVLHIGLLPCKWGMSTSSIYSMDSPLLQIMTKVGSSVGSGVGCSWEFYHANAAHYFHIRI